MGIMLWRQTSRHRHHARDPQCIGETLGCDKPGPHAAPLQQGVHCDSAAMAKTLDLSQKLREGKAFGLGGQPQSLDHACANIRLRRRLEYGNVAFFLRDADVRERAADINSNLIRTHTSPPPELRPQSCFASR